MKVSRKNFIRTVALGTVGATTSSFAVASKNNTTQPEDHKLTVGLASYTLRKYSLDEVIDIALGLNLTDVAFKSFHLPYESTDEELRLISAKVKARGLNLYGGGVIYMKTPEDIEKYFNYAKAAGLKMIIGVTTHELLPQIEKKVKETDIKLAIHNHGPEDEIFPSPKSVYDKIKNLDKRIGLCMDMGHTFRLNLDPAEEIKKYKDRLLDVHIKDINEQNAEGKPVEIGRGKMNIPSLLAALKEVKYSGIVGIEYEKDGEHAKFGLAESVGYVRAVLDVI
ncbi:sugar phosphate isomerase/epimerase [Aurantibacter crassamenti]|uniref:sugar phosphate isomerase/epimerase family protein n=1 Tax=Aurantibacter crassamenti TaxID=1837375 RepID=UPI00193A811F|nr:sugar phosphate isomerase/epimerase [Aurantibacter crassamenti]MBM1107540.1 sugar phosphate isomerase/epimerase [Aurantibacter crassamenti]